MFRFSYKLMGVSVGLILVAGFLAFVAPRLNPERQEADALAVYLTRLANQTRQDYAQTRDLALLNDMVFQFNHKGKVREIVLLGEGDSFRFRLTRLPDKLCAFLLARWQTAQMPKVRASVIETEETNVSWRALAATGSATCYGAPNKKLNALELTFRR
jgi:hypothetical protein